MLDNFPHSNQAIWKDRILGRSDWKRDDSRWEDPREYLEYQKCRNTDSENQNTVQQLQFESNESTCSVQQNLLAENKRKESIDENGNITETFTPPRGLLPTENALKALHVTSNDVNNLTGGSKYQENKCMPVVSEVQKRGGTVRFPNKRKGVVARLTESNLTGIRSAEHFLFFATHLVLPSSFQASSGQLESLNSSSSETAQPVAVKKSRKEDVSLDRLYNTDRGIFKKPAERCCSSHICGPKSVQAFPDMIADAGECECECERICDLSCPLPERGDAETSYDTPAFEESDKCEMTLGKTILVTGGAGYIGSHAVIELVEAGYDIVVIDNLVNASMESIRRVEKIVGKPIPSYSVDLLDKAALDEVFNKHTISAVIHFAGLKAVGESCELPLLYYKTNVGGTTNLLEVMEEHKVYNLVFSSSATVYGKPQFLPLTEDHPVGGCTNPYGKTKFMIEQILQDISSSNKNWNMVLLRYFNPVGSHKSGMIGEDPQGVPNNLMPYIAQVAVGRRERLKIYGSDYDTHDGTGVRDYIHVVDLAQGHVAAVRKLEEKCGLKIYNLGTGRGYSVLDMAKAFEKASGKKIPYELAERRPGDVASCYSDTSKAARELNWTAKKGLDEMCEDLWRWQSKNPQGYNTPSS